MKNFKTSINGYDKLEVIEFLNSVTKEYESILSKLKVQEEELKSLRSNPVNINETFEKAVYVAEEAGKQIKRNAQNEASLIIDKAKNDASRILNDSLIRARRVNEESEELRRKIVLYKRRIKGVIEDQLLVIDDIDKVNL